MKKILLLFFFLLAVFSLASGGFAKEASKESAGGKLFKKHCAKCHPDGGNIIKMDKTLSAEVREKNRIKTEEDIIRLMRNPGPGMVKFGEKVISEKEAKAIAEYIMKTYK